MNTYTVSYTIFTHSAVTIQADSMEAAMQQVRAAWKSYAHLRDNQTRLNEVGESIDKVGDLALDITWVNTTL